MDFEKVYGFIRTTIAPAVISAARSSLSTASPLFSAILGQRFLYIQLLSINFMRCIHCKLN